MLKLKLQYLGHLIQRASSLEKTLMLGKIEDREEKGMTEDEMIGWPYQLNGHQFEQALGVGDGQGSLACCSPWGHKESDTTEPLNNNKREWGTMGRRGSGAAFQIGTNLRLGSQTPVI